jgi:hypothetical protein
MFRMEKGVGARRAVPLQTRPTFSTQRTQRKPPTWSTGVVGAHGVRPQGAFRRLGNGTVGDIFVDIKSIGGYIWLGFPFAVNVAIPVLFDTLHAGLLY